MEIVTIGKQNHPFLYKNFDKTNVYLYALYYISNKYDHLSSGNIFLNKPSVKKIKMLVRSNKTLYG